MWKSTNDRYGRIARLLHWGMALLLIALFVTGWWATELGYYDPLYRVIPDLHRGLGVLAGALIVLRLAWLLVGYLMSTADGRGVDVFGLFELPALLSPSSGREEWAGRAHYLLAFGGAWLVVLHVAAALKHQFIDRDGTLRKMIG